ncbi:MAG: DUF362 domain-containing protein [Endomicrobium sp.]|jgi:uncharacterized protein (DUF362 family)|nr:DUF362 domain-containing protein [Endomicrobium sp.]
MNRRKFIKSAAFAALVTAAASKFPKAVLSQNTPGVSSLPDVVGVRNGTPVEMFRKGIDALGCMQAFVKPGQKVIIKPNISFDSGPERGANTNPDLVAEIVRQAKAAGASNVSVFDHTLNEWRSSYKNSGTQDAVERAGGTMLPANDGKYYEYMRRPQAKKLKESALFKQMLEADVFINVPILKNHGGAKMSCAIKNLMGVVWDRRSWHGNGLNQSIAEVLYYIKPSLNVIDAYRVLRANGPRGVSVDDVDIKKYMIISKDIVAADSAALGVIGYGLSDVPYVKIAGDLGFGEYDLSKLKIERISIN